MPGGDSAASAAAPAAAFTRVRVLAKVRDILDLFDLERPELHMAEIRRRSGLPASTCARLVQNMIADGLLDQHDNDRYRIGLAVVRWAAVAREGLGLSEVAAPELRRLRDVVGETTGLFVRDGALRVCIALAEGTQIVGRRLTLGHVAPLHANAAGKAILAFDAEALAAIQGQELARFTAATKADMGDLIADLAEIRRRGFAVSRGEWHKDVGGTAAPIRDASGRVIASVGVSVPIARLTHEALPLLAAAVTDAADRMSVALGNRLGA